MFCAKHLKLNLNIHQKYFVVLQKENGELKEELATKTKELEKMQTNGRENVTTYYISF